MAVYTIARGWGVGAVLEVVPSVLTWCWVGSLEGVGLLRATLTLSSRLLRGLLSHCIAILKVIL